MPLKKKLPNSISLNEAKIICEKNGIAVYPVKIESFWYVEVSVNGVVKETIRKEISSSAILCSTKRKYKEVDWVKAIEKTIIHYAVKFNRLEVERLSGKNL